MTNVLFICSANKLRSPTAEAVFGKYDGIEIESAGMDRGAPVEISSDLVEWADMIFVMEKKHRQKLSSKFKSYLKNKRVVCLDIPDDYEYMDVDLVKILEKKVAPLLRLR